MKKLIIMMVTLLTLTVFAKPLSTGDLDKINNYLSQVFGENDYGVYLKFLSANVNDNDGLLDSSKVEIGFFGLSTDVSIHMENELVKLSAEIDAPADQLVDEYSDFEEMYDAIEEEVDKINAKNNFKVSMIQSKTGRGIDLRLLIKAKDANSILKSIIVKIFAPKDLSKNFSASVSGDFFSAHETVGLGRVALTNIVNDLIASKEPSEEDMETLAKIIADLLEEIDAEE